MSQSSQPLALSSPSILSNKIENHPIKIHHDVAKREREEVARQRNTRNAWKEKRMRISNFQTTSTSMS
jgi:hypothetical protein